MKRILMGCLLGALLGCGSATEVCGKCDTAGLYESCTDCPDAVTCKKTIREKNGGAVIFTCSEKSGGSLQAGCFTAKSLELCK